MPRPSRPGSPIGAAVAVGLAVLAVLVVAACGAPTDRNATPQGREAQVAQRVTLIGDSYTNGAGSSDGTGLWTGFAAQHGWHVTSLAHGGTGYISSPAGGAVSQRNCSNDSCPSYTDVLGAVAETEPDIVIVSGGRNDVLQPTAALEAGIPAFYAALRTAVPDAEIYATSPLWGSTAPPASLAVIGEAVRTSVESVDGTYLDLGQPLEGERGLVSDDGVHPNDLGYAALAEAVGRAWPSDD